MPSTRKRPTKSAEAKRPKSPRKKSESGSLKNPDIDTRYEPIVKSLLDEIQGYGTDIKNAVTKKRVFPAQSKAAKKSQVSKAVQARVLKKALGRHLTQTELDKHQQVTTAILKRGIASELKQLGSRPIALLATTAVSKGLDLKSIQAKGTLTTNVEGKQITKLISKELKAVAKLPPSTVKSRSDQSAAKIAVNTEIVKRAVVADIKKKVKRFSPKFSKSPKAPSPSRKSPVLKTPTSPIKH